MPAPSPARDGPSAPERRPHAALDRETRVRKARKIAAIVGGDRFRTARAILEVGCGSGVIASVLAHLAGGNANVHAVDVVDNRVVSEGYAFQVVDGTTLPYSNDTFDIVVSNHVIEHVGNADAQRHHLDEIRRVLAPDGVVYFAAPNRWRLVEPHFRLPFLSWLPHPASDRYVRVMGRGSHYDCDPPSYARAVLLCRSAGFELRNRTVDVLRETLEVELNGPLPRVVSWLLPDLVAHALMPVMPTYVFTLEQGRT